MFPCALGHPDRLGVPVASIPVSVRGCSYIFPSGATVRIGSAQDSDGLAVLPPAWRQLQLLGGPGLTPPDALTGLTTDAATPASPLVRETVTATLLSRQ